MSNIKQGYKQTDIGVIPEDWEVKPLYDCCSKITDGTHDTPKQVDFGIPYITAIHVKEIGIDFNNCYFLPESVHRIIYNRCNPELDDILMVNIGAGVGTTALVNVGYEFSLKNVALLKPNKSHLIGSFLNYWQIFSKSNILQTVMTGGAQPFLSLNQIGSLKIALPTITEQTAIATALSDTDALIATLDKKIAKKQQIKQGAMQQLLTGKKRLSGFSGEWVEKKICEVGKVITGSTPSRSNPDLWNGNFVWVSAQDLKSKYIVDSVEKITEDGKNTCRVLPPNSVLVTCIASIGLNALSKVACATNQQINSVVCNSDNEPEFLYYQINNNVENLKMIAGQTAVPIINKGQFENFTLMFPNAKSEQTAIAQILTDMDNEIAQLEKERDKYKELKAGMMQVLLTGKIRLI